MSHSESVGNAGRPKNAHDRRSNFRLQISLGLLLLLCLLSAIAFRYAKEQYRMAGAQRLAVDWIGKKQHGVIRYSSQPRELGFVDPRGTKLGFASRLIGKEYLDSIEELSLYDPKLADLSPLSTQRGLRYVTVSSDANLDLGGLEGLEELEELSLHAMRVDSLRPLYTLPKLKVLRIIETQVAPAEVEAFRTVRPEVQLTVVP